MNRARPIGLPAILGIALALAAGFGFAQVRTARERASYGMPNWTNQVFFDKDVFTFARIQYASAGRYRYDYWGSRLGRWAIDFPESDLNLSYRLQQMTSLKVDPDTKVIQITDKELFDFPWIYIVEPGGLQFSDEEVTILRKYLLNGGFLMVDDFWGEYEWANFYREIKRVFPDREPVDLDMNHPIFHCVFDLKLEKQQMQVPNIGVGMQSEYSGITWEQNHGPDSKEVHFRAIYDDKGRMIVMICHNTDNGDGWEQEGVSEYYFREFSEKKAYPLGINIIFYAMSH